MSFKFIIFIFIHLVVLVFFIEMLRRVNKRVGEYVLQDNKNTVPFGFIKLGHIVVLYILTYLVWLVLSVILYIVFIHNPSSFYDGGNISEKTDSLIELNF